MGWASAYIRGGMHGRSRFVIDFSLHDRAAKRTEHTVSETYVSPKVYMFLFMYRHRDFVFVIGHGWDTMGLVLSNHVGLSVFRGDRERCWRTSRIALRDNAGWDICLCLDFAVFVAVDVVCCAAENIDQAVTHSHKLRV